MPQECANLQPMNACDPHFVQEDGKCVTSPHRNFDNLAPAGSMVSSLRDLERWFALFAQRVSRTASAS